jgi:hypothetical protein
VNPFTRRRRTETGGEPVYKPLPRLPAPELGEAWRERDPEPRLLIPAEMPAEAVEAFESVFARALRDAARLPAVSMSGMQPSRPNEDPDCWFRHDVAAPEPAPPIAESSEDLAEGEPHMDEDDKPLPPGVLGYVVVLSDGYGRGFLPDTDLRSREAAQRQVDSWNKTLTFRGRAVLCEVRAAGEGG